MMNVLLINGSPNKEGCTYTALKEVADTLNHCGIETEIFHIGLEASGGCRGCGGCKQTGRCAFGSDNLAKLFEKAEKADGLIVGTPVHYAASSGAISCVMDKMFTAIPGKLAYKPGACVVSCRRGGASATFDEMNKYFTINKMPVVASQYWNSVHGSCAEDVKKDEEGLQIMRVLGRNMAWLLHCIEAGKKTGVPMPEQEEHLWTSFIR